MSPEEADASRLLEVLKEGPTRRVELRGTLDGGRLVRKIHRGPRAKRRAEREALALSKALRSGVPCPQVLALRHEPDSSWLELEFLVDHRSLESRFPADATRREPGTKALGVVPPALRLVENLVAAGIDDPDLHAGNVLCSPEDELRLVDLHRARRVHPLSRSRAARRAKLRFLRFFLPFATREWWARVFAGLAHLDPLDLNRAETSRRRLLRGKDRRARRGHRSFERSREPGAERWRRCDLEERGLRRAEAVLDGRAAPAEILKERTSVRVLALDERWVLKLFAPGNAQAWRRARAAWRASLALQHSRVPCATAWALWLGPDRCAVLAERRCGPRLSEHVYAGRTSEREQLRLARALARSIGLMHREGLRARDLRAENFVLDEKGRPAIVDLEGIARRRRRAISWQLGARDTARLRASFPSPAPLEARAVELFVRVYAAERGLSPPVVRRWRQLAEQRVQRFWDLWRARGYTWNAAGIHDPERYGIEQS